MKVLVTGSNGQLGQCLQDVVFQSNVTSNFVFLNASELDITNKSQIEKTFTSNNFDYCVNCAAYTAVDKAENEKDKAYAVNADGVKLLAQACKKYGVKLIHISTDFVFDGEQSTPYSEEDKPNPIIICATLWGQNWNSDQIAALG